MELLRRTLLLTRYTPFHPKYWRFFSDFLEMRRLSKGHPRRPTLRWADRLPALDDWTPRTTYDPHYLYHPAWAARILAANKPSLHIDIGSTLHFAAILSAFVPVEFYDIRPAATNLPGLVAKTGNLLALPFANESVHSMSCMHVVEHIGLGRYGDPIDPDGDLKAMAELRRVLAKGGSLLLVVPVGQPRLRFNSHRIYGYGQVMEQFPGLELIQFALINDRDDFRIDASAEEADKQIYGCGCWWFKK